MSQVPPQSVSDANDAQSISVTALLRHWLDRHRPLVILLSTAATATAIAGLIPSDRALSAAQASPDSTWISPLTAPPVTAQTSEIEIRPRGADANHSTVPFRRNVIPERPHRRSASAASVPTTSTTDRRAVLQTPVFSKPGTTRPASAANASRLPSTEPGQPAAIPRRSTSGYNFVDAAQIESLPYAGQAQTNENVDPLSLTAPSDQGDLRFPPPEPIQPPASPGELPPAPVTPVPASPVPAIPFPLTHESGARDSSAPNDSPLGSGPALMVPPGVAGPHLTQPDLPQGTAQPHGPSNLPPTHSQGQPPAFVNPSESGQSTGQQSVPDNAVPSAPYAITPNDHSMLAPNSGHSFSGSAPGTSGFRATIEADAPRWMGPYMGRAGEFPSGPEVTPTPAPSVEMSPDFSAWWDVSVRQRAGIAPRGIPVDVTTLVQKALIHSPQVQVLQSDPEVQLRVVKQEEAVFDWRAFLDTKYDDLNDPIGNTLTTGNNDDRFTDRHLVGSGGVKRRTTTGGELRLSQQLGYQDNNSRFLLPNPQSTSRLELSFRQPLLSQAGTVYSQSQIVLARINANSSGDETLEELQKHLYSVAEVYWRLYRARAEFFQRQKLLTSARNVLATLEARNQVDTIPRQILRARASVARAESRMQRAVSDIRNAESQLRLLVNDPEMLSGGPVEFMPTETPYMMESPVELRQSLETALVNRPDISQAIRQMRASGVRMGVSKSEMLPKLDFIVSSYVAGLENKAQFVDSIGNQFTDGRPGYTVGMEFEVPLGNRAGKARVEQRQWELKRAINSFRATVETSLTEVEISNREVETSWRELLGKFQAMMAAQNEVSYLQDRFDVLPMAEESSILLLEDLLDGFERLADEESAFAQAQSNYALSIIQLRRATGTLMRSRHDAPELDQSESEWMASRAEQLAGEAEDATHTVSLTRDRSEELRNAVEASRTPAAWTIPVGNRPTEKSREADQFPDGEQASGNPVAERPAGKSPVRPPGTRLGGHSFGSDF